jgi:DNA-binding transcriptional LysR family regulator
MNTNHLSYFLAVAETGSMSKAADNLFITHQCLSAAMNNLEKELGAKLLNRSSQGVSLTDNGKIVYDMSKKILREIADTKRTISMQNTQNTELTKMRVFVSDNILTDAFIQSVKRLLQMDHNIALSIHATAPQDALARLQSGSADIICCLIPRDYIPGPEDNIQIISVYQETPFVLMKADHTLAQRKSLTLSDIADYPLVVRHSIFGEDDERVYNDLWKSTDVKPMIALSTDNISIWKQGIAAGLGVGIINLVMLRALDSSGDLNQFNLTAVKLRKGFGLNIFCLANKDFYTANKDLVDQFDSILSSYLPVKRISEKKLDPAS